MKIVVLTGAGMSAESGFKTFRDSDGLWEEYDINDVATPEALERNPQFVLDFYNNLRKQLEKARPNAGHYALVEIEQKHEVYIITQNVDNLHERAGSKNVIHLHGELTKAQSIDNDNLIVDIGYKEIHLGDKGRDGFQLRPHIVFFGEAVPMLDTAVKITSGADIFVVIGSSLNVYPAASLIHYAPPYAKLFLIDPNDVTIPYGLNVNIIKEVASKGVEKLKVILQQ